MSEQIFTDLTARLKTLVNEEFQKQKLDMASLMAILFALGQAKNKEELVYTANAFADRFPVIDAFLKEIGSQEKKSLESDISTIIKKIVATDPAKAVQIAKDAMQPGMTLEKLTEKYPEIKNYL